MSVIDDEAIRWTLQRTEREQSDAERAAFQAWYDADVRHRGAYVRALSIHQALSRAAVQKNLRPAVSGLAAAMPEDEFGADGIPVQLAAPTWGTRRRWLAFGAMAAGVAVLGVRVLMPAEQPALVLMTAKGEHRTVPLADQSVAAVNSDSRIEVRYTAQARQIALLKGEAWFQVTKDKSKPFTVQAGAVRVQAVGTAFAVRRQDDGAEVFVTEGTVAVWAGANGQRHALTAGESALLSNSGSSMTVRRSPQEVLRQLAWREGKLVFTNQTLKEAVAEFNRYSVKPIVIADERLESRTLIGQYRTDAPERFARDVSAFLSVPYLVTATEILIGK